MLEKIDQFIIDRMFQPAADWFNDLVGKSNFWLARMCWWANIVLWGAHDAVTHDVPGLTLWLLASASGLATIAFWQKADTKAERSANRVMNPARLFFPHGAMRLLLVAVWLIAIAHDLVRPQVSEPVNLIAFSAFCSAMYFAACTPRPRRPLTASNRLAAQASSA